MNYKRKESLRREMLACAREAAAEQKFGNAEESKRWLALAQKRLFELNGMRGNW
ncbi:hypothetical protein LJR296_007948 [Cupriavidus necator]|uniref:hypothetical protein n=1 Tax=Cupriavidus necator TaxID=106590 RepID=UPI003ECDDE3B